MFARLAPAGANGRRSEKEVVTTGPLGPFEDQYLRDPVEERLGIACSGGGIRSASYCLGALQVLRERKILGQAEYLSAVSGGAYISIAHHLLVSDSLKAGETALAAEAELFGELAPYAPGSPEEKYLRDNTTYIAPGILGRLWLGLNLAFASLAGLLTFLSVLYLMSGVLGLWYRRWLGLGKGIVVGDAWSRLHALPARPVLVAFAIPVVLIINLYALRMRMRAWALRCLQPAILITFSVWVAVAFIMVALPLIITRLGDPRNAPGGASYYWPLALLGYGGSALVAKIAEKKATLMALAGKISATRWIAIAGTVCSVFAVMVPVVLFTYRVAWGPGPWPHMWLAGIAGATICAVLLVRFYSSAALPIAHVFYRDRLGIPFVGRRIKKCDKPPTFAYVQGDWDQPSLLSELDLGTGAAKLPKLVVCATANVDGPDIPPGRRGVSITFEKQYSGGPAVGYVRTSDLEREAGKDLTLPGMMAISGAAFSSTMGWHTITSLRLLMTVFNINLGSWLPNPARCPRPRFTAAQLRRLHASDIDKALAHLPTGSLEVAKPHLGLTHLLREASGLGMNTHQRNLFVSDGGHWENLGLVELLRRGCGRIICLDAAGDDLQHFATIGRAIALARSELGVEILFNHVHGDERQVPQDLVAPPMDSPFSKKACVRATIMYPDGTRGVLLFVKAVIAEDAPEDAIAYNGHDPRFPCHKVTDQFFDDEQFESYRAIGRHAAAQASDELVRTIGKDNLCASDLNCHLRPAT